VRRAAQGRREGAVRARDAGPAITGVVKYRYWPLKAAGRL
jgi:hypothetical protein